MKSIYDVEKAVYYGYSYNWENRNEFNIGFRIGGLYDHIRQFIIHIPVNGPWKHIVNRKKNNKVGHVFVHIDLGGLGVGALGHGPVEVGVGHRGTQIVPVFPVAQGHVEAGPADVPGFQQLGGQIHRGAAA